MDFMELMHIMNDIINAAEKENKGLKIICNRLRILVEDLKGKLNGFSQERAESLKELKGQVKSLRKEKTELKKSYRMYVELVKRLTCKRVWGKPDSIAKVISMFVEGPKDVFSKKWHSYNKGDV